MKNRKKTIIFNGVDIFVTRKCMKYLRARVSASGEVNVSAPAWVSQTEITLFLKNNWSWLVAQIDKANTHRKKYSMQYCEGAQWHLWGEVKCLSFNRNDARSSNTMYLLLNSDASSDEIEKSLDNYYKQEMIRIALPLIDTWSSRMGVVVSRVTFRKMKSRWGSCNASLKKINLNTELAKYPVACLEYVIVHELSHYFESHHNRKFWKIVESYYPSWRQYHNQLNQSRID